MVTPKKKGKKIVKKTAKKTVKKSVKKGARTSAKKVKKIAKKSIRKPVKKIVKKIAKKTAKKSAAKTKSIAKAVKPTLLGVMELGEGKSASVIAAVKDAILRNTEEHPFYESTDDKSTVVVAKEVEFVDTARGVYMIPVGTTISVIRDDMGGVWTVERHVD